MKITKEITFDSAHMLSDYVGKCTNLHGHTYKLQVVVEGEIRSNRMVIDFNDLKKTIEETVMVNFDHAVIFSDSKFRNEAEQALYEWAKKYNKKYFVMPYGKTTCEDIAPVIQENLQLVLGSGYKIGVRLWETPTSFAEV